MTNYFPNSRPDTSNNELTIQKIELSISTTEEAAKATDQSHFKYFASQVYQKYLQRFESA